jgi:hypothetical protein
MTVPRIGLSILILLVAVTAGAEGRMDATELAQITQNPLADMVSVPLRHDINGDVAKTEQYQSVFNAQGIYPFHIGDRYNLITRSKLPIISQPSVLTKDSRQGGIGDFEVAALFTPVLPGKWIWGVGPVGTLPTASRASMGTDKLGLGVAADVLRIQGPWVYGVMFKDIFSVLGDSAKPDAHTMHLEPFVYYNFDDGWYAVSAPTITADWEAGGGDTWTIPLGAGFGRSFYGGNMPMNAGAHFYRNLDKPSTGADWTLRLIFQILFPNVR